MDEQNQCHGCIQHDRCQEAFGRLGRFEGPSVVSKVLIAFLMPMVVFIVSLAVLGRLLASAGLGPALTNVVSIVGSLAAVALSIFVVRTVPVLLKTKGRSKKTI